MQVFMNCKGRRWEFMGSIFPNLFRLTENLKFLFILQIFLETFQIL
jgi:hypothetical protein